MFVLWREIPSSPELLVLSSHPRLGILLQDQAPEALRAPAWVSLLAEARPGSLPAGDPLGVHVMLQCPSSEYRAMSVTQ